MENSGDFNKATSNISYSKNSKSQTSSNFEMSDPKKRYQAVLQQEKEKEINKLHKKIQKDREEEEKLYRKHLKTEINKRKKELEQLQRLKESGTQLYKKATHQADIKKEKDKIKKMEQEIRSKTADQRSKRRYKQAVEKQKTIDEELNNKKTIAQQLRKSHAKIKVAQRCEAAKFNKSLQQRRIKQQEEKTKQQIESVSQHRDGLKNHGIDGKINKSAQPLTFVAKQNQEDEDAFNKAQSQQLRNQQRQKLRAQVLEKNRKTAADRGNDVLSKMQRERQYQAYCRQAEEQQKRYNLRRLQAGKRNQYVGIKPLTISQIDLNKKLRSQEEFQKMFVPGVRYAKDQRANKYNIVETKMKNVISEPKKVEKWVKKPINYAEGESLIPGVSQGHYSFQSQGEVDLRRQSRKSQVKINQNEEINLKPIMKETGLSHKKESIVKTRLKQNQIIRQELNYSDSQQDSAN